MSEVIIEKDNFQVEVLESEIPVIVDFWATWCGPCRMLSPIIAEIAEELDGKVKVCKVNVDDEPEIAGRYGIESIPTVMLFRNGELVKKSVGYVPKDKLLEEFEL